MSKNLFDLLKTHNLRQVKLVLESQCDVNCRNDKKETPLMVCMVYLDDAAKRKEVIRLFKKKGADSNLQNSRGQTALIYSCALNQPDSAAILLEEAALDVDLADIEGNTALTYACASNNERMVKLILEKCAAKKKKIDFARENVDGMTAVHYASSNEKLVQLFATYAAVSKTGKPEQPKKSDASRDRSKKTNLLSMIEELQQNSGQTSAKIESKAMGKTSVSDTKKPDASRSATSNATPKPSGHGPTSDSKKNDVKQSADATPATKTSQQKAGTTESVSSTPVPENSSKSKTTAPPAGNSDKVQNEQPKTPNPSPVQAKRTTVPSAKRRPSLPRQNSRVSKSVSSTPRTDNNTSTSSVPSIQPRPKSRMKSAKKGPKEPTFRRGYIESQGDDSETDEEMDGLFDALRECAKELKDLHSSLPDKPERVEKMKKQPKLQEKRRRDSNAKNPVQLADMVKTYNTHPKIPKAALDSSKSKDGLPRMKKQNFSVGRAHLLPPPDAAPKFRETKNTLKPDTNTSDPTQPINVLARSGNSPFLGESMNESSGPRTGSSPFADARNGEDDQTLAESTWPPFGRPLPNIPKIDKDSAGNHIHPAPNKNVRIPLSRQVHVPPSTDRE